MMSVKAIGVLGLASLASASAAQSLDVYLDFGGATSITPGDVVQVNVVASFTGMPAGAYLSSVNIDLIASGPYVEASNVASVAWNNPGLGFDGQGTASGADVLGIQASQFSLIPPITTGSPIVIMTFDVTWVAGGMLSYQAVVADGAPFAFSVTGGGFSDPVVAFGVDAFHSATISTPAPGAVGVLALGGIIAGRRRRPVM